MAEYIEREAVIADLKEQVEKGREKGRDTAECEAAELVIQRFAEYIKSFPAADVQPVKRGKWKWDEKPIFGNPYGSYICSECGAQADYKENYCCECGADMRELTE